MMTDRFRFDTDILISIIEQTPVIWDTSLELYKNRKIKHQAWKDVAQMCIIQDDFKSLDKNKQQEAIKIIQQRWKSARDAYRRDVTKLRTSNASDSAKQIKKYIYFDNLRFLDKTLDLNETEIINFDEEENEALIECKKEYFDFEPSNEPIEDPLPHRNSGTRKKTKKDIDEKSMDFIYGSKKVEDNGNRAFLESLLPALNSFDETQILQFRAEVLRIVMKIKNIPSISCSDMKL